MRVVVPLVRTGTGEGDVPSTTEAGEMSVQELTPVIRMQGDDPPRVPAETRCQCNDYIGFCFVRTAPTSAHPVVQSVTVSVQPKSPTPSQKSSNTPDSVAFPAFRHACALTIVSFLRSWNRPSDWTNILGGQRELHSRCSFLIPRTSSILTSFTYLSHELTEPVSSIFG